MVLREPEDDLSVFMEAGMMTGKPCPMRNANVFSYLTWQWVHPLIVLGNKKPLEAEDLYDMIPEETARECERKYYQVLEEEQAKMKSKNAAAGVKEEEGPMSVSVSMWKLLWKSMGWKFMTGALYKAVWLVAVVLQVYILRGLVRIAQGTGHLHWWWATLLVLGMLVTSSTLSITQHHCFTIGQRTGTKARATIAMAVFNKLQEMRLASLVNTNTGIMLNLVTNDTQKVVDAATFFHFVWFALIEVAVVSGLVLYEAGYAAIPGVVLIFLTQPLQVKIAQYVGRVRRTAIAFTDSRVRSVNEVLTGVRVVKYNGWTAAFLKRIADLRASEMHWIRRANFYRASTSTLRDGVTPLSSLATFGTYVAIHGGAALTPSLAFTLLALFSILVRIFSIAPLGVQYVSEAIIAIQRLQQLLDLPNGHGLSTPNEKSEVLASNAICISNGVFSWTLKDWFSSENEAKKGKAKKRKAKKGDTGLKILAKNVPMSEKEVEEAATLKDLTFEVKRGELVAIVGAVGSGKSSLLLALLGEMECVGGVSVTDRPVAYAPQQPWIMNDTIRTNILFGSKYDETRYKETISACALDHDIAQFPARHDTEIGERGVNLSGGQKARISLARACYSTSPLLLLDDPLAAVDVPTAKHLMDHVLAGILKDRTVVLVTHNKTSLTFCDRIYLMEHGKLQEVGQDSELEIPLVSDAEESHDETDGIRLNFSDEESDDGPEFDALGGAAAVTEGVGRRELANSLEREPSLGNVTYVHMDQEKSATSSLTRNPASGRLSGKFSRRSSGQLSGKFSRRPSGQFSGKLSGRSAGRLNFSDEESDDGPEFDALGGAAAVTEGVGRRELANSLEREPSLGNVTYVQMDQEKSATSSLTRNPASGRLSGKFSRRSSGQLSGKFSRRPSGQFSGKLSGRSAGVNKEGAEENKGGQLTVKEDRVEGQVTWATYLKYAKDSGGLTFFLLVIALFVLAQAVRVMVDYWLSAWVDGQYNLTTKIYVISYACFAAAAIVLSLSRGLIFTQATMVSAKQMHGSMAERVLRSPQLFFDQNPVGRIVNRFSKDQALVDEVLPSTAQMCLENFVGCLGSIAIMAILIPWFLLCIPPFVVVFLYLQRRYVTVSRELKRLDGLSRSPMYAHFSQTLQGIASVRAFGAEKRMHDQFLGMIDANHRAFILFVHSSRWLGIRLDFAAAICVSVASLLVVLLRDKISPGLAGVVLVQSLQLTGFFQYGVRLAAETENYFTSVERIQAYSKLPTEADPNTAPGIITEEWPQNGEVEFLHYTMAYREDLPPVLNDLCFKVKAQEKVGILGRTGAGKSSLAAAMFRLVENRACSGSILIDGIDIAQVGLDDLRRRLSIIPQDPVLFRGTVRLNLDPFEQHSDVEINEAIARVHLSNKIATLEGGIDSQVAENGENFSVGQRQLLCLARSLLRRSRVIVMDEATAAVDGETDQLIQTTMRSVFHNCTVLTIAHRIDTIIDCHRVLVLAKGGRLAEFDTPANLLRRAEQGLSSSQGSQRGVGNYGFADIVAQSGPVIAQQLREAAEAAESRRNQQER